MDNYLILERLDRLEKLLLDRKEVLTFEETCDYRNIQKLSLQTDVFRKHSALQAQWENDLF